jgi:uncharacterized protein
MRQTWHNLLFAHWPISPEKLRPLIPQPLQLDRFDRSAWIAVTPFHMDLRARGIPAPPLHFPELNCRTYVTFGGKPGVFFFSLDAGSRLAVWGARALYLLPYFYSRMRVQRHGEQISYSSRRAGAKAALVAQYQPDSPMRRSQPGSLEHWLTERYCLYACTRSHIYRGEIHHLPWPLQNAICEIHENQIATAAGIQLPNISPVLHFASRLEVLIWPLRRVDRLSV